MNTIDERNFPYPILLENGGDFLGASFNVKCLTRMSDDRKNIILSFTYELKCRFIEELIKNGNVKLVINIAQRTFRKTAMLNENSEVSIPINWLSPNHNLEIMPMLVASKDYKFEYDNSIDESFSYFDEPFEVQKYQIVGYGNFMPVPLPTNSKVGSIFTISKIKDVDEISKGHPYIVTFDTNVIDIKLLPDIYDSLVIAKQNHTSFIKLLYSTFVYPSVQLALIQMSQDYDNVKDLKWCIAINNKISKIKGLTINGNTDISKDDIVEYTHIVLDTLLQDAYKDINSGLEE